MRELTNRERFYVVGCMGYVLIPILMLLLVLLFGCSSPRRAIAVERVRVDSVFTGGVSRDSVFVCDSVFVERYVRGDTVFDTKEKWRVVYRDVLRHDTFVAVRRDTVPVVKYVERGGGGFGFSWLVFAFLFGGMVFVLYLCRR